VHYEEEKNYFAQNVREHSFILKYPSDVLIPPKYLTYCWKTMLQGL